MCTPAEVAKALKLSENTVRRMFRNKELPGIKVGQQWRIRKKDLERFLKNGKKEEKD
jgi:excisionase family DNA binding protein